jgi:hypothetical protein
MLDEMRRCRREAGYAEMPEDHMPYDPRDVWHPPRWLVPTAAIVAVVFAVAWFLVAYLATDASVRQAVTQTIGATLGLLLAYAIVGAILLARFGTRVR